MRTPAALTAPALDLGLNPYGLSWYLGLQGRGTARTNRQARGLEGFIELAGSLEARTLEIPQLWLADLDASALRELRRRLTTLEMTPIVSSGLPQDEMEGCFRSARTLGAALIRLSLTQVLCGDRHLIGDAWPELVDDVRRRLAVHAAHAAAQGTTIVIENHQDFTSGELVAFCEELGPAIRIVYDTGNSFPVAEAPLDFTRVVAPYVRHLHLKDYRVQTTDEGFRLVRCAIGDGAVPFPELLALLAQHHAKLPAVLEPGALESRHVRLLTAAWWRGYPQSSGVALAACLAAARRNRLPEAVDSRTPWECGADGDIARYELDMIERSAANIRALEGVS